MIPYGKHTVDDDDIAAVVDVLQNQFLTQGKQVPAFEKELTDYTGARHAIAVNSGTSALHIACLAAGVSHGDWVWTVPISFVASANCARYCGAGVDFVDIDPDTRNISVSRLQEKLSVAATQGRLPKVLIVVHFSGSSCDMLAIKRCLVDYSVVLIEDAAHGLGGSHDHSSRIGSGKYAEMTALSFHPVKSITTAEGGAVTTNSDDLAKKLKCYAGHGISREQSDFPLHEQSSPWYYAQTALGFNYRLSDLHAALGRSQLKKLDNLIAQRRQLAQHYHEQLIDLPIGKPLMDVNSAWHLYTITLNSHDRTSVFNALRERGIGVNVHYIPIHLQPYYQNLGFHAGQYPIAEDYYQRAITLPLFPGLSANKQDFVIRQLKEVLV